MGVVKKAIERSPHAFRFDALSITEFGAVSPSNGVLSSTVQARKILPVACKIPLVSVFYTAIQSILGTHFFNIAVGEGAYAATEGVAASQTATLANVPNHDGTVTTTINGTAVVYTEVSGDTTVTILAGHVVSAINANTTVNKLVVATNVAGVITITALKSGTAGNTITLVCATTDSSTTYTAGGATLAGGVNATAPTTPPSDQSDFGAPWVLGASVASGYAASGQAMFAADQAITAALGVGAPANQPALAAATTSGGILRVIPTVPDAIYPAGTELTLRVVTPFNIGSISNLIVGLAYLPVLPIQQAPSNNNVWSAGYDF